MTDFQAKHASAAENRLSAIVDALARAADAAFIEIAGRAEQSLAKISEAR